MSSFGSLTLFLYPSLQTELDQLTQGLLAWSLALVNVFPVACAVGGIVVPGVLFWRRSRHVKRVATVVATPTTSSTQSSRGFVAKKLQHLPADPASYADVPIIGATFTFNEVVILN